MVGDIRRRKNSTSLPPAKQTFSFQLASANYFHFVGKWKKAQWTFLAQLPFSEVCSWGKSPITWSLTPLFHDHSFMAWQANPT